MDNIDKVITQHKDSLDNKQPNIPDLNISDPNDKSLDIIKQNANLYENQLSGDSPQLSQPPPVIPLSENQPDVSSSIIKQLEKSTSEIPSSVINQLENSLSENQPIQTNPYDPILLRDSKYTSCDEICVENTCDNILSQKKKNSLRRTPRLVNEL